MDGYTILKVLHVGLAIVWLGGGMAMLILGMRADRARDDAELVRVVQNVIYMASHVFVPSALGVVIAGVVMVFLGQDWSDLWVILGLVGFAITFSMGKFVIEPRAKRMIEVVGKEGVGQGAVQIGKEIIAIAKFDFAMLFVVMADMVLKPQLQDWPTLVVMALVVVGSAVIFLAPLRSRAVAAV